MTFEGMDMGTLLLWTSKILPAAAGLLLAMGLLALERTGRTKSLLNNWMVFRGMRKAKKGTGYYERMTGWLRKNGAGYHYGRKCTPAILLACSGAFGVLGMVAGIRISVATGLGIGVGLTLLPWILLPSLNRRDNERMLQDIRLIYTSLAMQIRSGIYVTDAMAEVYSCVTERRLRDALLELAGDVVMKADIYEALDRFEERFDNQYIDSLCITILQAMESGQAVELLRDIGEQVHDMEEAVMERRKGRLDRSLTFYQLGMLGAVLAVALYSCVVYMLNAARGI